MLLAIWVIAFIANSLLLGYFASSGSWVSVAIISPAALLAVIRVAQILSMKDVEIIAEQDAYRKRKANQSIN
jgi:hypothetical protein